MRTAGIVLCGGSSSRMGRAKAWLPWRGRPMVAHVARVLRDAVDEVVVVASAELELPPLDARVVRDREPGRGPLAGIREGLACSDAELAFVCATDSPYLTPVFVKALLDVGGAVVPEVDGHLQTLCAVYPRSVLPCADALLARDRRRPLFLLEAAGHRTLGAHELPDTDSVRGFNTPAEYLDAVRREEPDATATLELLGRARVAAGVGAFELPVGSLAELLAQVRPALELVEEDRVASAFAVSLDGRSFVRDARVPVGPGEHAIVLDAAVGG